MKNYSFKEIFTEPEILSQIISEIIYILIVRSYLIHLNNFNELMFAKGLTSKLKESNSVLIASEILKEGGYSYLCQAILWVVVGIAYFYFFYKIGQTSSYPVIDLIIKIFHTIVLILFLVILWRLIDNPIVHAVIILMGFSSLVTAALSN